MLRELTPVAYADENDIVRYHQTDNIPSEEVLDNWIIAGIVTPAQRAASLGQRPHETRQSHLRIEAAMAGGTIQ